MDNTVQLEAILKLQHERARRVGQRGQGNYQAYENIKKTLTALRLTPDEYEAEARRVAEELGV